MLLVTRPSLTQRPGRIFDLPRPSSCRAALVAPHRVPRLVAPVRPHHRWKNRWTKTWQWVNAGSEDILSSWRLYKAVSRQPWQVLKLEHHTPGIHWPHVFFCQNERILSESCGVFWARLPCWNPLAWIDWLLCWQHEAGQPKLLGFKGATRQHGQLEMCQLLQMIHEIHLKQGGLHLLESKNCFLQKKPQLIQVLAVLVGHVKCLPELCNSTVLDGRHRF